MAEPPPATPTEDSLERMVLDLEAVVELSEASLCKYFDVLLNKKEPSLPNWLKPTANGNLVSATFKSLVKSLSLMPKEKMKPSLTQEQLFPSVFKKTSTENPPESESEEVIRKRKRQANEKQPGDTADKRSKSKHQ